MAEVPFDLEYGSTFSMYFYNTHFPNAVCDVYVGINGKLSWTKIKTGVAQYEKFDYTVEKSMSQYLTTTNQEIWVQCEFREGSTIKNTTTWKPYFNMKLTSDMKPALDMTITDPTGYADKYGGYVQGKSQVKVSFAETLYYGSPISSRSVSMNGTMFTELPYTHDVIQDTSLSVVGKITDGRAASDTETATPIVFAYANPQIKSFTVSRCDSSGALQDGGAYALCDYSVEISSINSQNSKTAKILYKQIDASTWSESAVTLDAYTATGSIIIPADSNTSFDVKMTLTDDFATVSSATISLGTAFSLIDFHSSGQGVALGKAAESENLFDCNFPATFRQGIKVSGKSMLDLIYPVGAVYISVTSTDPGVLFGGTWEQIKDKFLLSAGDTYEAGATGGESEHTLTTDEMPNHNHEYILHWNKSSTIGTSGTAGLVTGSATTTTDPNTESAGGGQAHNNMPPYLVVYVWKRTA